MTPNEKLMQHLESLLETLPEAAKDLRLNMQNVLASSSLDTSQAWGTALASAYFVRHAALRDALLADAGEKLEDAAVDDARAAASLMGMNTVYYRFRHLVGKESYASRRAGLRMNRMMSPKTSRAEFEIFSLACGILAGCEACIKSHEANVIKAGVSEEQVNDVARIAATVAGVAVALGLDNTGA